VYQEKVTLSGGINRKNIFNRFFFFGKFAYNSSCGVSAVSAAGKYKV